MAVTGPARDGQGRPLPRPGRGRTIDCGHGPVPQSGSDWGRSGDCGHGKATGASLRHGGPGDRAGRAVQAATAASRVPPAAVASDRDCGHGKRSPAEAADGPTASAVMVTSHGKATGAGLGHDDTDSTQMMIMRAPVLSHLPGRGPMRPATCAPRTPGPGPTRIVHWRYEWAAALPLESRPGAVRLRQLRPWQMRSR